MVCGPSRTTPGHLRHTVVLSLVQWLRYIIIMSEAADCNQSFLELFAMTVRQVGLCIAQRSSSRLTLQWWDCFVLSLLQLLIGNW